MSSTIFFFLFIPLLAFILLAVNIILAPHNPYMEKNSAFECGFSSFLGQNRTQFSISFFIFALLFLLFDLEILLVYPYLVSAYTNGIYGLTILLLFLLALTLGFAFELGKKALSIDSRQLTSTSIKVTKDKLNYISNSHVNNDFFLNVNRKHYSTIIRRGNVYCYFTLHFLLSYAKYIVYISSMKWIYSFTAWAHLLYVVIYNSVNIYTLYFYNIVFNMFFYVTHVFIILEDIYFEKRSLYFLDFLAIYMYRFCAYFLCNPITLLIFLTLYVACLCATYYTSFTIFIFISLISTTFCILLVLVFVYKCKD